MATYASLADVMATFGSQSEKLTDEEQARLTDLLAVATEQINAECGMAAPGDFFRHPADAGVETRLFNGDGTNRIMADIISVTSVERSAGTGESYTLLTGADWYLEPASPEAGWPFEWLYLSAVGSYTTFTRGHHTVRVVGAFGWAAVPADVKQACIDRTRQLFNADPSAAGTVLAVDESGRPVVSGSRLPDSMWRVKHRYATRASRRFAFIGDG